MRFLRFIKESEQILNNVDTLLVILFELWLQECNFFNFYSLFIYLSVFVIYLCTYFLICVSTKNALLRNVEFLSRESIVINP